MSEPKKPAKPADVDERNLVEVGPEFAEASFEDKVFLWWVDNKAKVIGGVFGLLLAVGGYQTYQVVVTNREINLRIESGQALDDTAKLTAFAKANPDTPQAGAAWMLLAERQYKAREYSAAQESYKAAAAIQSQIKFNGFSLGRAELGAALAQLAVNPVDGQASLLALSTNQAILPATRAEALYKLAVLAVDKKDWTSARSHLDTLDKLGATSDAAETWNLKAEDLKDELPPEAKPTAPAVSPTPTVEKK